MSVEVADFLEHHGVKGMKWGVRKDTPSSSQVGFVDPVTVSYATAVLATVAVQGIVVGRESGAFRAGITKGKRYMTMNPEYWDKKPSLASKSYSADQIRDKVLPGINPKYPSPGASMNCRRATFAYEMRRRGYEVEATRTKFAHGGTTQGLTKALNMKGRDAKASRAIMDLNGGGQKLIGSGDGKQIFGALGKEPDRSRGELIVNWKSPQPGIPGGAHSLAYEVIKGKPHVFDAQSGIKHESSSFIFSNTANSSYTRLDNQDLNKSHLTKWLK